jgi:hypothetical protein
MEILKLKNKIAKIKYSIDGHSRSIQRTREPEWKSIENSRLKDGHEMKG